MYDGEQQACLLNSVWLAPRSLTWNKKFDKHYSLTRIAVCKHNYLTKDNKFDEGQQNHGIELQDL